MSRAAWPLGVALTALFACARAEAPVEFVEKEGSRETRIQARVDSAASRVIVRLRVFDNDSLVHSAVFDYGGKSETTSCTVFSSRSWMCRGNSLSWEMAVDGNTLRSSSMIGDSASLTLYTAQAVKP